MARTRLWASEPMDDEEGTDSEGDSETTRCIRKSTDSMQKDQHEALTDEIRSLEARLEELQRRLGVSPVAVDDTQLLGLAQFQFQSLMAQYEHAVPIEPVASLAIRLPRDRAARHAMLRAMQPLKLQRANALVSDRLGSLRETQPYMAEERFVSRAPDYHCRRIDLYPFRGLAGGARQLYDALLECLRSGEMSVTEMAAQRTLRCDVDAVDRTLWTQRIVSTTSDGSYVQDLNTAGFAAFDEHRRCGVIAIDSIDADDLAPYAPAERVRHDVTAALVVCEGSRDPSLVVLKRCVFVTIHAPPVPLPASVTDHIVAPFAHWRAVLTQRNKAP